MFISNLVNNSRINYFCVITMRLFIFMVLAIVSVARWHLPFLLKTMLNITFFRTWKIHLEQTIVFIQFRAIIFHNFWRGLSSLQQGTYTFIEVTELSSALQKTFLTKSIVVDVRSLTNYSKTVVMPENIELITKVVMWHAVKLRHVWVLVWKASVRHCVTAWHNLKRKLVLCLGEGPLEKIPSRNIKGSL